MAVFTQINDTQLAAFMADYALGDVKGFKGIVDGEYDYLPEAAFYMVGTIEEAVEKGKKLNAEAA